MSLEKARLGIFFLNLHSRVFQKKENFVFLFVFPKLLRNYNIFILILF